MFGTFGNSKQTSAHAASGSAASGSAASPAGMGAIGAKRGHVIVIGNEKGGSGKTTTTMHLIVALLRLGFSIGSIDIDSRQRSLSRYVENRVSLATREGVKMPMPMHAVVTRSPFGQQEEAEADERERFTRTINKLLANNDFVVIDSPGSDTYLSRFAHSFADTIITPINDSFVDLDVLATVDGNTLKIVRPSIYSEMVWEQKLLRAKRDGGSIEWIVMRNRLSNIDARNKRFMGQVLSELSRRIGFRAAPGFSERVIFREMFLQGLTVLDVMDNGANTSISLSHVAARQEVRDLLKTLRIPLIDERVASLRIEAEEAAAPALQQASALPGQVSPGQALPGQAAPNHMAGGQAPSGQPTGAEPAAILRASTATHRPATAVRPAPPVAQPIGSAHAATGGHYGTGPGFAPPPPPPSAFFAAPSLPETAPMEREPASGSPVSSVSNATDLPAYGSIAASDFHAAGSDFTRSTPDLRLPASTAPSTAGTPMAERREDAAFAPMPDASAGDAFMGDASGEDAEPLELIVPAAAMPPAPSDRFSLSPAAHAPSSPALTSLAKEGHFLMSSSMLQQAASALRSAAKQALSAHPRQAGPAVGAEGPARPGLPDIAMVEQHAAARAQAERTMDLLVSASAGLPETTATDQPESAEAEGEYPHRARNLEAAS